MTVSRRLYHQRSEATAGSKTTSSSSANARTLMMVLGQPITTLDVLNATNPWIPAHSARQWSSERDTSQMGTSSTRPAVSWFTPEELIPISSSTYQQLKQSRPSELPLVHLAMVLSSAFPTRRFRIMWPHSHSINVAHLQRCRWSRPTTRCVLVDLDGKRSTPACCHLQVMLTSMRWVSPTNLMDSMAGVRQILMPERARILPAQPMVLLT